MPKQNHWADDSDPIELQIGRDISNDVSNVVKYTDRYSERMQPILSGRLTRCRLGPITIVRLSRPDKRNALDGEMIADIDAFFAAPPVGTRAIILYAEGKHFSAGADLTMLASTTLPISSNVSTAFHQAFDRIENSAVPVVAVLHGAVIGGGLELAAAAHIRIAERSVYYKLPESAHGIFVGGGGAVRIPRLIGTCRMMDMMLTGRTYGAEEGMALGFSQYVVDDGSGLAKAEELAERIAANSALSNFAITQALPRIARASPDSGYLTERLMATIAVGDAEAKLRMSAFLEERAERSTYAAGDQS